MSQQGGLRRLARLDGWVCQDCLRQSRHAQKRAFSGSLRSVKSGVERSSIVPALRQSGNVQRFSTSRPLREITRRAPRLPDGPARTRFAPSPTGYLHIGGLRTALFSYLLAKRTNGQFLLRIEDTDQKRLVPGAEARLLDDLRWAGLQWDEGPEIGGPYGPYRQSERNRIYRKHALELLESVAAYRCFCTPQTAGHGQAAYITSGCYQSCSTLSSEESLDRAEDKHDPFTVRLKRPQDAKKRVYRDLVYGKIVPLKRSATPAGSDDPDGDSFGSAADTILMKSDGTPTYHFANVVDDHLMRITHVIRGVEWMASTPLHYDLYHAFGWTPPEFAHVGLLVDQNKAKLSKRNVDTGLALGVRSMREEQGVLPETLVNFLALLGWSNPLRDDVFDMNGLIDNFDLKFTKGNTMVRFEKLWFLQKQHVARRCEKARWDGDADQFAPIASQVSLVVQDRWPDLVGGERFPTIEKLGEYINDILLADSKSYDNAARYVERNRYLFESHASASITSGGAAPVLTDVSTAAAERADTDQAIEVLVQDILHSDFKRPFHLPDMMEKVLTDENTFTAPGFRWMWFDYVSARIHAVVQYEVLKAVLAEARPDTQPPRLDVDIPLTTKHLTDNTLLHYFNTALGQGSASMSTTPQGKHVPCFEATAMLKAKKDLQANLMRYLRGKLSFGLPGPSIGVVMALLGYEECCTRLGVEMKEGIGWEGVDIRDFEK